MRLGDLLEKQRLARRDPRLSRGARSIAPDDREILRRVVDQLDDARQPARGRAADGAPARRRDARARPGARRQARDDVGGRRRLQGRAAHARARAQVGARRPRDPRSPREVVPRPRAVVRARRADDARRRAHGRRPPRSTRLREAAAVYSGHLGQPLKAAEVLRKARQRAPHVAELVTDHAAALAAAGELDAAQRAVGEALATVQGAGRTSLLLLRAIVPPAARRRRVRGPGSDRGVRARQGRASPRPRQRPRAPAQPRRARRRPADRAHRDAQARPAADRRTAISSAAAASSSRGSSAIRATPSRCTMLCDLDESIEHWDGVAAAATRLAYVTEGDAQVNAALRAADAVDEGGPSRRRGAGPRARPPGSSPAVEVIRDKLREMYEAAGEFRLLAGILTADADHGSDPADALRELQARRRAPALPPRGCGRGAGPRRRRRSSSSPTITPR